MKGVIFTEFLQMLEDTYGDVFVESFIIECQLPSGGSYTSVGTYEFSEMQILVTQLSAKTDTPVDQLLYSFGQYLYGRFVYLYPSFFVAHTTSFSFLKTLHNHIHIEV